MSKSTLGMSHQGWLEDRKKSIGGSDVGTTLGLNKRKSPYQLWLEKTGQVVIEESENEPAYWGNVLEEVVTKEFQEWTSKKVRRRNQMLEHPLHPFLRANIDRDVIGENAILERKTANQFLGKEWEGEEVPLNYLCQVQHCTNVSNKDYCYIAVSIGGQGFIWRWIARDQESVDTITGRLVEFWETNVVEGIESIIDESEAAVDFLKEKYVDVEGNQTALPSRFDELIGQEREFRRTKKEIESIIHRINSEIISELERREASIGITQRNIINWESVSTKRMNMKKLVEKYPDIANDEEVYSITESRRLIEKEIK